MRFTVEIKNIDVPDQCELWVSLDEEELSFTLLGRLRTLKKDHDESNFWTEDWGQGELTTEKLDPDNTYVNMFRIARLPSGPASLRVGQERNKNYGPDRDYPHYTFTVEVIDPDQPKACVVYMYVDSVTLPKLQTRLETLKSPGDEYSVSFGRQDDDLWLTDHERYPDELLVETKKTSSLVQAVRFVRV